MRARLLLLAAAMAWLPASGAAARDALFRPEAFFAGRTAGDGELRVLLGAARALHVQSRGRVLRDGTLLLTQRIEQEGEAPRTRIWRLRRLSDTRYAGTLSDAEGPVTAEVTGNVLRVRYTMTGSLRLRIDQSLELQRGGRTVRNRLVARKLGLTIATVSETIRKLP